MKEIKDLKDEHRNQFKKLHDEINKLFDVIKSVHEMQKASVTLPYHLQQAQASGMMQRQSVKDPCLSGMTYQTGAPGSVTSQQNSVNITTSSAPVYQMYGQSSGQQIPGPGFFSASEVSISNTSNVQSVSVPVTQNSGEPLVTSSRQAVSAASVSGPSLFMMPKGQISTSFPLPMPGAAKPPDISALTSTVTQPPTVVKSPDKYVEEFDRETDGEATTPETSFSDYKPLVSLPEVITKS